MATMNEVDVYNIVLEAIGQRPISGQTVSVADKWVSQIQRFILNAKRSVLLNDGMGWIFNTESVTLNPDANVNGYLPTSAYLDCKLPKPFINRTYNNILCVYNRDENSFVTDAMTNVPIIRDSDWSDIPTEAKMVIGYRAAINMLVSTKGAVAEANYYAGKEVEAFGQLEHNYSVNSDAGEGTGANQLKGFFNY